jgi:hypothetical protein
MLLLLACSGAAFSSLYPGHSRSWPEPVSFTSEERMAGLDRQIPAFEFTGLRLPEAVLKLQEISGTKITMRWDSLAKVIGSSDRKISMSRHHGTLDEALQDLMEVLRSGVGYEPGEGGIVVAAQCDLPHVVRVYDARELMSPMGSDLPRGRTPSEEIEETVVQCVDRSTWHDWDSVPTGRRAFFRTAAMGEFSGRLEVLQTPDHHRQIERLLSAIAAAKPDGTGPSLEGNRPVFSGKELTPTGLRVYDVRDLIAHRQYSSTPDPRRKGLPPEHYTGIEALEMMIIDGVLPQSWCYTCGWPGEIHSLGGRLIVVQTPENQPKVAAFLSGLRASQK